MENEPMGKLRVFRAIYIVVILNLTVAVANAFFIAATSFPVGSLWLLIVSLDGVIRVDALPSSLSKDGAYLIVKRTGDVKGFHPLDGWQFAGFNVAPPDDASFIAAQVPIWALALVAYWMLWLVRRRIRRPRGAFEVVISRSVPPSRDGELNL